MFSTYSFLFCCLSTRGPEVSHPSWRFLYTFGNPGRLCAAAAGQRDRPQGGFEKLYKVKTPFLNVSPAVVNRYYIYGLPRQKSDRFLAFDSKTVGEKMEEKR